MQYLLSKYANNTNTIKLKEIISNMESNLNDAVVRIKENNNEYKKTYFNKIFIYLKYFNYYFNYLFEFLALNKKIIDNDLLVDRYFQNIINYCFNNNNGNNIESIESNLNMLTYYYQYAN